MQAQLLLQGELHCRQGRQFQSVIRRQAVSVSEHHPEAGCTAE